MPEINAVVGYIPDKVAKALKGRPTEALEIKLDRGSENATYVRVRAEDIAGVITGASSKGETGVQVFLNDNADVETVTRHTAASRLTPIRDLTFSPLRPPINVIYVDPRNLAKLLDISKIKVSK